MSLHLQLPQAPDAVSHQLHPLIHRVGAALLIWFVAAAWLLFGGAGYIDLALAMISVLVFMVIVIPAALWRAKIRISGDGPPPQANRDAAVKAPPLVVWLQGEFATYSGREKSSAAAVEMLLPVAAVALGITVLGIAFDLIRAGAV